MQKTIINAKGSRELKEAIRIVAFNEGHSNSSKTIVAVLEQDPAIKRELKKLQRSSKNKVAAV